MYSKKFSHYLEHDRQQQQENIDDPTNNDSNTIPRRLKIINTLITNEKAIENGITLNVNNEIENITLGRPPLHQNIPGFIRSNMIKKQDDRHKKHASPMYLID